MATNDLQLNDNIVVSALGTYIYNSLAAGYYTVQVQSTLPANSGLSINIKQGASSIVSVGGATTNPTPTQQAIGTSARIQSTGSDIISVVLASSAAADQLPNAIKTTINLFAGE